MASRFREVSRWRDCGFVVPLPNPFMVKGSGMSAEVVAL
jgi:hypothetical protein